MAVPANRSAWAESVWAGEIDPSQDAAERNTALVRHFFEEVWNRGNFSVIDELLSPNFVDHSLPPGLPHGLAGYKASVTMFRTAFPDIQFTLDQVLAEGDRVALRLTGHGTHRGPFMGIPATGKKVQFTSMTFIWIENGKVAERWAISDMPGLMAQLGVGPGQPAPRVRTPYDHVSIVGPKESKSTTRVLGTTNLTKATKDDTRGIFSFFVSIVPPGAFVPTHTHWKEDECYYILEGELELQDATNKVIEIVGPETYVYVPMGINHGFRNASNKPARLILVITPGGLESFFEGIGQFVEGPDSPDVESAGPMDFARAARVAAQYNITFDMPGQ